MPDWIAAIIIVLVFVLGLGLLLAFVISDLARRVRALESRADDERKPKPGG
jgi:predicted PurR-regulated permease PerM